MTGIATFLRLALAAGLSGAAAGLLLAFALFFGAQFGESWAGAGSGLLSDLYFFSLFGITMGIFVAGLPAFFAGAALWGLSRHRRAARHAFAWAGAGAAVGACLWALLELSFWTPGRGPRLSYADAGFLLACLMAGAGGALTFRAAMTCTAFMEE